MKKGAIIVFAIAAFLAPSLKVQAQTPFEGSLTWTMSIPAIGPEKHEMLINVKGDQTETETDLGVYGNIKTWLDKSKQVMYMYNESVHQAFSMKTGDKKPANGNTPITIIKPTGKTATIAGHQAQEFTTTISEGTLHLWGASDFPADMRESIATTMKSSSRSKDGGQAFEALIAKGMVPVKVQMEKDGETMMEMELQKVEQKKLDSSIFELPKGVEFKDASAMGAAH